MTDATVNACHGTTRGSRTPLPAFDAYHAGGAHHPLMKCRPSGNATDQATSGMVYSFKTSSTSRECGEGWCVEKLSGTSGRDWSRFES